jgi:hypothetical protein
VIRPFRLSDLEDAKKIHADNALPECCFPDLMVEVEGGAVEENLLYVDKSVYTVNDEPAMMCFLKMRSELYLLMNHKVGTPEERFKWLKEFKTHMVRQAWLQGLDQMTAFLPPEIEESFGKRLKELGFERSSYNAYSLNVP